MCSKGQWLTHTIDEDLSKWGGTCGCKLTVEMSTKNKASASKELKEVRTTKGMPVVWIFANTL